MLSILVLFLVSMVGVQGCMVHDQLVARQAERIDAWANPWLGKTKDARMQVVGPPDRCAALSDSEVCEWSTLGVSNSTDNCAWNSAYGGAQCGSVDGFPWKHRIRYTYRDGIATEWSYRGSWGQRSSQSSRTSHTEFGFGEH